MNEYTFGYWPKKGRDDKRIVLTKYGTSIYDVFDAAKAEALTDNPDAHGFCATIVYK